MKNKFIFTILILVYVSQINSQDEPIIEQIKPLYILPDNMPITNKTSLGRKWFTKKNKFVPGESAPGTRTAHKNAAAAPEAGPGHLRIDVCPGISGFPVTGCHNKLHGIK